MVTRLESQRIDSHTFSMFVKSGEHTYPVIPKQNMFGFSELVEYTA